MLASLEHEVIQGGSAHDEDGKGLVDVERIFRIDVKEAIGV